MNALRDALARLWDGRALDGAGAGAAIAEIVDGQAAPVLIAAFLAALRARGERVEHVAAAARVLRERAELVQTRRTPVVDTCGTGGDGGGTFNVSTATAFVVAGAGVAVAKHGNRAASGRFGGADVLEALGVTIDLGPEAASRCLDEIGMVFLFAPRFHPAMRHVAPIRRELGLRTIFNLLGPLTNPARVRRQVIGVASQEALRLVAGALVELDVEHALVVHSRDGVDEITLSAITDVVEVREGRLREFVLSAAELGLPAATHRALAVATVEESAAVIRGVLAGQSGPARDVVLANAAAALFVAGQAPGPREGVGLAAAAIDSGAAAGVLEGLVRFSTAHGASRVREEG